MEQLKAWYRFEIAVNQKAAKRVRLGFRALIVLLFFNWLAIPIIFWVVSGFEINMFTDLLTYPDLGWSFFFNFLYSTALGGVVFDFYLKDKRRFKNLVQSAEIQNIEKDKIPRLVKIVDALKNKMELYEIDIVFWRSNSKTFFPSIEEFKGSINLILPMNFFYLLQREPEMCEALIAHELGHLVQKDVKMLHFNFLFGRVLRGVVYPITFVYFSLQIFIFLLWFNGSIFAEGSGYPTNLLNLSLASIFFNVCKDGFTKSQESRLLSEELADTAAIIYSNGQKLKEVFELYLVDKDPEEGLHPPKSQRIRLIEYKLKAIGT